MGEELVVGAGAVDFVGHEAAELVFEERAWGADGREDFVGVEVPVESEREFLWRCEGEELRGKVLCRVVVFVIVVWRRLWVRGGGGGGGGGGGEL